MRTRSVLTHSAQAIAEGSLIALLVVGLMAGTALAGKPTANGGKGKPGGTTGGGTVAFQVASDTNGNGELNWGDSVTYAVTATATLYPYVSTSCVQGRTQVLSTSAGFFDSYPWPSAKVVPLKTQLWTSGGASCTATLYSNDGGTRTNLASQAFTVAP